MIEKWNSSLDTNSHGGSVQKRQKIIAEVTLMFVKHTGLPFTIELLEIAT